MLDITKVVKFEWTAAGDNELALAMPCGTSAQIKGSTLELRLPEQGTLRMTCDSIADAKALAVDRWHAWILGRLAKLHRSGPANTICIPLTD